MSPFFPNHGNQGGKNNNNVAGGGQSTESPRSAEEVFLRAQDRFCSLDAAVGLSYWRLSSGALIYYIVRDGRE